jgi:hypothetical protein
MIFLTKKRFLVLAIGAFCLFPITAYSQSSSDNNTNSSQSNFVWGLLGGIGVTSTVIGWIVKNYLDESKKNAERARQLDTDKSVNSGLDPVRILLKEFEERLDKFDKEFDKYQLLGEERYNRQKEVNREIIEDKIANGCQRVEQRAMEEIKALQKQTKDNSMDIQKLEKLVSEYVLSNQKMIKEISEMNGLTREEIRVATSKTEILTNLVTNIYEKLSPR